MKLHRRILCLVFVVLSLTLPVTAFSQALFVEPGRFLISNSCTAYTSFRNETGAVELEVNKVYTAYGENKNPGASHVYLDVNGQRKWASLNCGGYDGPKPPFVGNGSDDSHGTDCLPFFDNEDNPVDVGFGGNVDITPPAPQIDSFGAAVNQMCGAPGKQTSREEFKQLLNSHPQVLADLMTFTGGKVYANRAATQDRDVYLEDLSEAWYAVQAFDHIFCGEPESASSLGGLHYFGRYEQLQDKGEACRLPNYSKNEVVPGTIYSMGATMAMAGGGWASGNIKGYGLTLSAEDILMGATRAFAENPTSSTSSTGCILDLQDTTDADVHYDIVFVRRAAGIRTFYPDATPDFNTNDACSAPIVLDEVDSGCEDEAEVPGVLRAGKYRFKVLSVEPDGFTLQVKECN